MRIEVKWRSGRRSVVNSVRANRIYEIDEAGAEVKANIEQPTTNNQPPTAASDQPSTVSHQPIYEEVSQLIGHVHYEEPYDDFGRQPLLPKKLSQLGPGVAWYDVDGDGWEDLIIGTGVSGHLAVYRNNGQGGFERWERAPLDKPANRDL